MSSSGNDQAPIVVTQDSPYAQRLLAAQSRLYTDAKRIHDTRVVSVVLLAAATIVAALLFPSARAAIGAVGAVITFLWSVLGANREKRCRKDAASVQEAFDTHVFALPWNEFAADRPSPTLIAEAAARYRGSRTKHWYPDTADVVRPLDILICQRSNLGWGASMHRFYAAALTCGLTLSILLCIGVAVAVGLPVTEALVAVVVPLLAPVREVVEMVRANRDSADIKAKIEAKVLGLWERGMKDPEEVTVADCRDVQNLILAIRQTNAHVPDWLDNFRRNRNESVMLAGTRHLVEEAVRRGKTNGRQNP